MVGRFLLAQKTPSRSGCWGLLLACLRYRSLLPPLSLRSPTAVSAAFGSYARGRFAPSRGFACSRFGVFYLATPCIIGSAATPCRGRQVQRGNIPRTPSLRFAALVSLRSPPAAPRVPF